MTNGFSFVTQYLVELSKDGINLLLSGDKSLGTRTNQKIHRSKRMNKEDLKEKINDSYQKALEEANEKL